MNDSDAGAESPAQPADDQPENRPQRTAAEPTGVRAADEARARLAELDDLPVDAQVEVYEDLHRGLQEGLADLDER